MTTQIRTPKSRRRECRRRWVIARKWYRVALRELDNYEDGAVHRKWMSQLNYERGQMRKWAAARVSTAALSEPDPREIVRCSEWLERLTLFRHCTHDGKAIPWMWQLVGWVGLENSWSLHWHPHAKSCRYGLYLNLRAPCGLVACLNLPLLGDWSVWRGSGRRRSNDEAVRRAEEKL